MGRRKVEIKRIQDKSCRQIAFCKRRKGLLKKAKELSILCDVDVAVVVISNRGRLYEFSSTNSLTGILQRYESHVEAEKETSEIQVAESSRGKRSSPELLKRSLSNWNYFQHSKYSGFTTLGELLQTTERQLGETNADDLTVSDLIHLENELQTSLIQVRSRKTHLMLESAKGLHEKEKLLRAENKLLEDNIATIKKNTKVNEMSTDFADLPAPHIICGQERATLNFL